MTLACALPPEIKEVQYALGFLLFSKKLRHREDLQHYMQRQDAGCGENL